MSARPDPPLSTDSPEELAAHVPQHPSEWLLYLRNVNACLSALEGEHASLGEERVSLRTTVQQREAVIEYQEKNFEKNLQTAQQKITQLEIEKHQLATAATPAILQRERLSLLLSQVPAPPNSVRNYLTQRNLTVLAETFADSRSKFTPR